MECRTLRLGNLKSEKQFGLTIKGDIYKQNLKTSIGTVEKSHSVLTFNKKGAEISFQLIPDNLNNDIHIEISEVHQGHKNAFAYTLLANDKLVYFRAYTDFFNAVQHHFIKVDKSFFKGSESIKFTVKSEGNFPFSIDTIWIYEDFYSLAAEQRTYKKMGVNLFFDAKKDIAEQYNQYPKYQSFNIGVMFGMPYLQLNYKELKGYIDNIFKKAEVLGFSPFIMPARWWAYTPYSVDGIGGYFSDVKYNQVVYDKKEGCYKLSTPNMWSSTLWPTMNDRHYEEIAAEKLRYLSDYAAKKMSCRDNKPFAFVLEWGSGYWVNNAIDGGDFSDLVIEAAKKDDVVLIPENGLDENQIKWMFKNVARYVQNLAKAYNQGAGDGVIIVNNGEISYPKYQNFDNVFSHTIQSELYPSNSDFIPGWSSGVTENVWPSSEMYEFTSKCHYDYSLSYGKLSCVNLEITMLTEESFKRYFTFGYECGMEFITMFNAHLKTEPQLLKEIDGLENNKCGKSDEYFETKSDIDFLRDYDFINLEHKDTLILSYDNLTISSEGDLVKSAPQKAGYLILSVEDQNNFENGLDFYLEGYTQGNGKIEIFAGTDINCLEKSADFVMGEKLTWFNKHSGFNALLSCARGNNRVYIKLLMTGANTSIRAYRVNLLWNFTQGYQSDTVITSKEKRIQNLWIQKRAIAERYLDYYLNKIKAPDKSFKEAAKLFENQKFEGVISLLNKEISRALPSSFAITGTGRLDNYPIIISANEPVFVRLFSIAEKIELEFYSDKEQNVILKTDTGRKYSLQRIKSRIILECDENGNIEFLLAVGENRKMLKEGRYSVIACGVTENSIKVESQEPEVGEYASFVELPLADDCVFLRKRDIDNEFTHEKPKAQDKLTIKVNNNGIIGEVLAEYGFAEGKVINYEPPCIKGKVSNGIITLDNGESYEFYHNHNYSSVRIGKIDTKVKNLELSVLQTLIKKGMKLKIEYTPYTYKCSNKRILSVKSEEYI